MTIQHLFEHQVKSVPNHLAIVYEEHCLTYDVLNQRVNQLAHYLRSMYSIQGDDVIALCLDRSEMMPIAILAVLKAGAGYVPLDPNAPDERLRFILKDIQPKVVLTASDYQKKFESFHVDVLAMNDNSLIQKLSQESVDNIEPITLPNHLAYIIYTSGTTGKPKGVMIEHHSVMNLIAAQAKVLKLNQAKQQRGLFYANYIFDAHVVDLFTLLLTGNQVYILNDETRTSLKLLSAYIEKHQIDIATIPPVLLTADHLLQLNTLIVAGDKTHQLVMNAYKKNGVRVINGYGPTESTVCTTMHDYQLGDLNTNIGQPIDNIDVYALDENLRPVAIGEIGELYIGGEGLARGYLNQPDLTAERFIVSPFDSKTKLYKTGDLVRSLSGGDLEYIGRNDFQVKIRGYRVETGEIEHQLLMYPGIQQATVQLTEKKQLIGYYVADKLVDEKELWNTLALSLPDYMVPPFFVFMKSFPLTTSGKINRQALPQPHYERQESYLAPQNDIEQTICRVFGEVLDIDVDKISVTEDFFRLGGNSLLAIKLVNQLSYLFKKEISIHQLYKTRTIQNLGQTLLNEAIENTNIPLCPADTVYPLSLAQERLWFIENYQGSSNTYHISWIGQLKSVIDLSLLQKAIEQVISRHDALHTKIKMDDQGNGCQEIIDLKQEPFQIQVQDFIEQNRLMSAVQKQVDTPFLLDKEYPARVALYCLDDKKSEEKHYLSIVIHHIAIDGWSMDIFWREAEVFYQHYLDNTPINLPPLFIQYKDFAVWQRNYLRGEKLDQALAFWKAKLNGYETLNLPTDYPRPAQVTYDGKNETFTIDEETSLTLRSLSQELNVSLYSVLVAGFNLLLSSYSHQEDIVVGMPLSNRHYAQVENVIGFFINTLVLRTQIDFTQPLHHYIQQIGKEVIEVQLHQELPFDQLVNAMVSKKDFSRHPLFQVMFSLQRFGASNTNLFTGNLKDEILSDSFHPPARWDLTVMMDDSQSELTGSFNYATRLFSSETIRQYICTYQHILKQIANDASKRIRDITYLDETDYKRVINNWSKPTVSITTPVETVQHLFEQQVNLNPNHVALKFDNFSFTYDELNHRVNQLAHYLRKTINIHGDDCIALCLERSELMPIAILGVLKSGAAYLPLDPAAPKERLRYMIEDTQAKYVLTQQNISEKLSDFGVPLLLLDTQEVKQVLSVESKQNPDLKSEAQHLAYVMYTSGTTGKPKGVMVEHQALCGFVQNKDYVQINTQSRVLGVADYVFDGSIFDFFTTLLNGGMLCLIRKEEVLDSQQLEQLIKKYAITHLFMTTSLFEYYALLPHSPLLNIKHIYFGGEKISAKSIQAIHQANPDIQLTNGYGPTENIMFATCCVVNENNVHIGKPLGDKTVYILNKYLQPLPVGAIGELYIGGKGIARGYLNQPELTAERFIQNPFEPNTRLYKTGDLVRYLPDGQLEYIGRNDFQVKILGHRIEMGEIEQQLLNFSGVKQAVVLVNENQQLIAYYVADSMLDEKEIRSYLQSHLPEYMVPPIYQFLAVLPLTINGKLDRHALPKPQSTFIEEKYIAPRNKLESVACDIFASIFGRDKISVQGDFFHLGGNSILAIKLVNQLNRAFISLGKNGLSIQQLFKERTIERLVLQVESEVVNSVHIPVCSDNEILPLSFAQERLWFIENYEGSSSIYHVPWIGELKAEIDLCLLEKAIQAVIARHTVLHTKIKIDEKGNGYQVISNLAKEPFIIEKRCFAHENELIDMLQTQFSRPFLLAEEYPVRVSLYTVRSKNQLTYYLNLLFHHIVCDGWSMDVFFRELELFYTHYHEKQILNLPILSIQYKDFALWQRSYLKGETLANELNYWQKKLENYIPLHLLTDYPRPAEVSYDGSDIEFELDDETSTQLRQLARECQVSLYSVLLSGFYLLLGSYANQKDMVIGTPLSNRQHAQVENLIGFFVNTLVLRHKIDTTLSIKEYICLVGEEVLDAQLHQELPFEQLVEHIQPERHRDRHPLYQIMFSVQHFEQSHRGALFQNDQTSQFLASDDNKKAKFDLTVILDGETGSSIKGVFNYATRLFSSKTIRQYIHTYQHILKQIASDASKKIREIEYLDSTHYRQVIEEWSKPIVSVATSAETVQYLFEQQVNLSPNHVALKVDNLSFTYDKLNERVNQLAHYLRKIINIQGDDCIALCLERSELMPIAILGVLKSGAAYVPLDPAAPKERLRYILEDTQAKYVLTQQNVSEKLSDFGVPLLLLDTQEVKQALSAESKQNLELAIKADHLAYVMYTSGTTGKPKGVMVEHQALCGFTQNRHYVQITSESRVLAYSDYVFDGSIFDFFTTLLNGGTLCLIRKEDILHVERLKAYIADYQISHLFITTALLQYYALLPNNPLLGIKSIYFGGEKGNPSSIMAMYDVASDIQLTHVYGPTENIVFSTYCVLNKENMNKLPIGKPLDDKSIYILDKHLRPLPIGAVGELYIGGKGMARGYLNQPELTAERFIQNPFEPNTRLYKTGDLVRYLPGGYVEYIGRNDFQVKIRGYRIETAEIEHRLLAFPGIKHAVVLVDENQHLIAYYVAKEPLNEKDIWRDLHSYLPEYMIPQALMFLTKLPLTVNGKLERHSLPKPEYTEIHSYIPPRNELDTIVCSVFSDVLGLTFDKIGIQDDFFRLGGDSIVSIQTVSRLRQHLSVQLSVKDIFQYRTVEGLSNYIQALQLQQPIEPKLQEKGKLDGAVNLLPIQKWFMDKVLSGEYQRPGHWNQSFLIKVKPLDQTLLKQSLVKLVEYHDVFRLQYSGVSPIVQSYGEQPIPDIHYLNKKSVKDEAEFEAILTSWQDQFDLLSGKPLYSVGYIDGYEDGSCRVFFALHHLLVDTVSWRIIIHDLQRLYAEVSAGNAMSGKTLLGEKGTSYRQWEEVLKHYANRHPQERLYWESVVSDLEIIQKPLLDSLKQESGVNQVNFELDSGTTKQLLTECHQAYYTEMNDLLLTALCLALGEVTKGDIHHILLEGHGREEIDARADVTHTVGWFTSMYPVRLLIDTHDLGRSVQQIKTSLREVPNKGVGFAPLFGYNDDVLPRISFNYLGQFEQGGLADNWHLVSESVGTSISEDNIDKDLLKVGGFVVKGQAHFYLMSRCDNNTLQTVARLFEQKLSALIRYLMKTEKCTYAVNDFQQSFEPYVVYSSESLTAKKLFLFPPGDGGAESYLADLLPKLSRYNVVAFNNYYLHILKQIDLEHQKHNVDYVFLAKFYIQYIKAIQPEGPYCLAGWCFGGTLAFEVCRQLALGGDDIHLLAMFDAQFNFKTVVAQWTQGQENNINSRYDPDALHEEALKRIKQVVLFQAKEFLSPPELKAFSTMFNDEAAEVMSLVSGHYASTNDNYLSNLLPASCFSVVEYASNHYTWLKNSIIVGEIVKELSERMNA